MYLEASTAQPYHQKFRSVLRRLLPYLFSAKYVWKIYCREYEKKETDIPVLGSVIQVAKSRL